MGDDFVITRVARSKREYVCNEAFGYNFVIPHNLVIKSSAVVEAEKKSSQKSKYINRKKYTGQLEESIEEIIAYFPGGIPHFTRFIFMLLVVLQKKPMLYFVLLNSSGAVYRMLEYYNIVKQYHSWLWVEISANVELFQNETERESIIPDLVGAKYQELASVVIRILQVFGAFDPCSVTAMRWTRSLRQWGVQLPRIRECQEVLPVRCSNFHWGVFVAGIAYYKEIPSVTSYFYEPLCNKSYRETIESTYENTVIRFLTSWHDATIPGGKSCAQVNSISKDSLHLTKATVTCDDVATMCLRIMWVILVRPEVSTREN
ncbi:hypothetical protein PHPALM_30873 [Phytophthora palmivora]|uniref:Ubiquitin-like protease family profile domain-containing protein n=1 Tax=Phytophthora palmivora TaxID=4796 RepID=A0A2P4X418_9STRA|nr:hypothetical protein PHPALM_30873 [Phytophthora palmivora]